MLVTMKEILDRAQKENYAVPAPNVVYEPETRAILELAEELNSPVILDVFPYFSRTIIDLAKESSVPVAVNLDHGGKFEDIIDAMVRGSSSVMVDRSMLPFEQNVAEVSEIVRYAHAAGISVEAELGHVGQGYQYEIDGKTALTDPDEAVEYVRQTGVDALAVAIGTAHGAYSGTPFLHFDLLEKLNSAVSVPLVLHGGSGTGFENIAKACRLGINKVNINTDLLNGALEELRIIVDNRENSNIYPAIAKGYKRVLKQYMEACGSIGKAWQPENRGVSTE